MANATIYNVELRDKNGNLKQYLTPFISKVSWEWNRIGGCGRCLITLKKTYRDITFGARDDIQIRIKSGSASVLVYRGWIGEVIPILKIGQEIKLNVRGYFDLLNFVIIQDGGAIKTYTSDLISEIVDDIADNFIAANTPITKGTIDASSFTADSMEFKTKVTSALQTLAELNGAIEYGVDEDLVFFWRDDSTTLNNKFFVGANVEILERRTNYNSLINKIYLEGGDVAGTIYTRSGEDTDSQSNFFLAETVIVNSAIVTNGVADRYISQVLGERSSPEIRLRCRVKNTNIRMEDTIPLGLVAIEDADSDATRAVWGTTTNGGSNFIWGIAENGGAGGIWGGVFSGQIDKIS